MQNRHFIASIVVAAVLCALLPILCAGQLFQFTPVPVRVTVDGIEYTCISTVEDFADPRFDGPILVCRKDRAYVKRAWHVRDYVGISRSSVLLLGGDVQVQGAMILMYFDETDSVSVLSTSYVPPESSHSLAEIKTILEEVIRKAAQPGATDNPDDAQRLREDH